MGFELATSMTVDKRYKLSLWLVCAYDILDVIKCMYYSKNSELKITLFLEKILANIHRRVQQCESSPGALWLVPIFIRNV